MWVPRRIEEFIEAIIVRLSAIQEAIRDQVAAINHAADRHDHAWRDIPRVIVEAQERTKNDQKPETRTESKKNRTVQWVIAAGTWGAVISASTYAFIAARQLCTSTKQLKDNEAFFRLDERAWVEPETLTLTDVEVHSHQGMEYVRLFIKNFGKTSATGLRLKSNNRGYEIGNEPSKEIILNDWLNPSHLLTEQISPILGPGNDTAIAPGKELIHIPYKAFGRTLGTAYVGRIEYDDIFGCHHWYTYCYYALAKDIFAACAYGNDEDSEKPK